jgi:urease accessory protein
MKYGFQTLIATVTVLVSPLALAHDHSLTTGLLAGLLHPLTGIDHLLPLTLAGMFIGCRWASRWIAITSLSLALVAGATAALLLGEQAWVEAVVLASLPLVLAVQWQIHRSIPKLAVTSMSWLMFAHGWRHAVELAAMNAEFVVGLLLISAAVVFLFSLFVSSVIFRSTTASHAHR